MKTWEMIKELEEHPEKEFESSSIGIEPLMAFIVDSKFVIKCIEDNIEFDFSVDELGVYTNWQEIKQLVGWDEAYAHIQKYPNNNEVKRFDDYFKFNKYGVFVTKMKAEITWHPAHAHMDYFSDRKDWELL